MYASAEPNNTAWRIVALSNTNHSTRDRQLPVRSSQTPWHFLAHVHFSTRLVFQFGLLNPIRDATATLHYQNQAASPTVKCAAKSKFP
jgi:hypothetical protein